MTDIKIRFDGVYLLCPQTDDGQDFLEGQLYTEPWQWLGKNLVVDSRYIVENILREAGDYGITYQ